MFVRLYRWIDARWPLSGVLRLGREEEIPGGASFSYALGSVTLFVFLLQVATGIAQLFYYAPTVDHAYDSLNYLRTEVPFGWLVHGLHYWGANAMVVLLGLHMIRVFIWGAYKAPRELTWLIGVCLLAVTAGLSFTGAPLPWDERGYWALEVGTSIAGTVPLVGNVVKELLRGGAAMGQLALARSFVLHVAILPGILLALVGVHLIAFWRFGSVGPWDEARRSRSGPFWPDQAAKDVFVIALLSVVLIGLCTYMPPPITGPADPLDTSYIPKPEWNFLFLYEVLKFLPGWLEPVGTVGVPTLVILLLTLLPFGDRHPERSPMRRPLVVTSGVALAAAVIALTAAGMLGRSKQAQTHTGAPPVGSATTSSDSARQGAKLFQSLGCIGCHRVNGTGGTSGPDLSNEALRDRSREWLITQLRNPQANNPQSIMPAFASLEDQQSQALIAYLLSLGTAGGTPPQATAGTASAKPASTPSGPPGAAAAIIGSTQHGAMLFSNSCASCHGSQGVGAVDHRAPGLNPIAPALFSRDPRTFAETIDRIIQHGAASAGPKLEARMPALGDAKTLTQQEIADVEAYVLQLNGVDRARLDHAGLSPRRFFYGVVTLVTLTGFGLASIWLYLRRSKDRVP